jgi:hypothetical protein
VPRLFHFPQQATQLCYALAGSYLGLSLFTDYPLSIRRVIPFKGHGVAEVVIGILLPFLPWLLGFPKHRLARNFILELTALTFIVVPLTRWK